MALAPSVLKTVKEINNNIGQSVFIAVVTTAVPSKFALSKNYLVLTNNSDVRQYFGNAPADIIGRCTILDPKELPANVSSKKTMCALSDRYGLVKCLETKVVVQYIEAMLKANPILTINSFAVLLLNELS